jgi:hypothetical protein
MSHCLPHSIEGFFCKFPRAGRAGKVIPFLFLSLKVTCQLVLEEVEIGSFSSDLQYNPELSSDACFDHWFVCLFCSARY